MVIFNAALAVIALVSYFFTTRVAKLNKEKTQFSFSTEGPPVEAYVSGGALLLLTLSSILTLFIV